MFKILGRVAAFVATILHAVTQDGYAKNYGDRIEPGEGR